MKLVSIAIIALLLAPLPALADTETARQEFNAAKKLYDKGDYVNAAKTFRAAYAANPSWKLHYNIGQCEAASKNYGPALEAFESYLAMGGDDVTEARREEVEKEISRLRGLVGFVSVDAPDGAVIFIAGAHRGTAPLPGPVPVTAGMPQEMRVTLGAEEILKRSIKISGGQTIAVVIPAKSGATASPVAVAVVAAPEEPTKTAETETPATQKPVAAEAQTKSETQPPVTQTPAKKSPLVPTGIALMAAGGAALITAGILGGAALSLEKDLQASCSADDGCPPDQHEDNDKMNAMATASTVLFPVGGVLAATGIVLFIIGKKKNGSSEKAAFTPLLAPGVAGMSFQGRF